MNTLANESFDNAWRTIATAIDQWTDAVRNRPRSVAMEERNNVLSLIHDYVQEDRVRAKEIRARVERKLGSEYYLY